MGTKNADDIRGRKLCYDDYAGRFYFESKVETIERNCKNRERQAGIMNRGERILLEYQNRQVHKAENLFQMKMSKEMVDLKDSLRDVRAYRNALAQVASKHDHSKDNYGTYGLGATLFEMQNEIEHEKTKMSGTYRRKCETNRLLRQRKPMAVIDRTIDTQELVDGWRRQRRVRCSTSRERTPMDESLVLPPIDTNSQSEELHLNLRPSSGIDRAETARSSLRFDPRSLMDDVPPPEVSTTLASNGLTLTRPTIGQGVKQPKPRQIASAKTGSVQSTPRQRSSRGTPRSGLRRPQPSQPIASVPDEIPAKSRGSTPKATPRKKQTPPAEALRQLPNSSRQATPKAKTRPPPPPSIYITDAARKPPSRRKATSPSGAPPQSPKKISLTKYHKDMISVTTDDGDSFRVPIDSKSRASSLFLTSEAEEGK